MVPGFDPQPVLSDGQFGVRPLRAGDREALFAAASDPKIWEQHPARDRWQRPVFDPYFDALLATGRTLVFLDRDHKDRVIGCSQYYAAPDVTGSISIGFTFLSRAYWGGAANLLFKGLMLDHAFAHVDEVWLHIAPDNWRSRRGTEKIGAIYRYTACIDVTGQRPPVDMACYAITRSEWEAWRAR